MTAADAETPESPPASTAPGPCASLPRWLAYLECLHPKGQAGIELGLERVLQVSKALHQATPFPVITVAGTNGKGSTCAYLEAMFAYAAYRVGCYASPHLLAYNERVRIDQEPVDDETLCAAFARVETARQVAGNLPLTYFEFGTLAAMEVFRAREVEVVILEVGLGGRLDAVNAYEPDCAVVTSIALDHTDWLGPTCETIGFEKAGIFRANKPAFCAEPDPPRSLVEHAASIGADLHILGRDFGYFGNRQQWTFWQRDGVRRGGLPLPSLRGRYQLSNACVALAVVERFRDRLPVPMQALRRGLIDLPLLGRFQVMAGRPAIVLDVAHNPQAVGVLAENLGGMGFFAQTIAVVGMLADKDIAGSLAPLAGRVDHWLLSDLNVRRGASAATLAQVVAAGRLGGTVECVSTPLAAFERAARLAGENDRIIVFGSFYTVAAVLRNIGNGRRTP